jgi:hypothetical protein
MVHKRTNGVADNPARYQNAQVSDETKAAAGLTAFFSIAEEWGLTTEQQMTLLGSPGRTTFFQWKRNQRGNLSRDTLDRLSYMLGIYKNLHILFSPDHVRQWLTNTNDNPIFNQQSPMEYMLGGSLMSLADVRRYLDWARG